MFRCSLFYRSSTRRAYVLAYRRPEAGIHGRAAVQVSNRVSKSLQVRRKMRRLVQLAITVCARSPSPTSLHHCGGGVLMKARVHGSMERRPFKCLASSSFCILRMSTDTQRQRTHTRNPANHLIVMLGPHKLHSPECHFVDEVASMTLLAGLLSRQDG